MHIWNCLCRGKYRPPNAAPDGEKPLYLHISAGAHVSLINQSYEALIDNMVGDLEF